MAVKIVYESIEEKVRRIIQKKDQKVFTEVKLLNGSICKILMPLGFQLSLVMRRFQQQQDLDMVPFFMEELCLIDNKEKDLEYFCTIMMDDYQTILEALGQVMNKLNL